MKESIHLKDMQLRMAAGLPSGGVEEQVVRRLWWAALETLQEDILIPMNLTKGLWLAAPLPALYKSKLLDRLQGWVWAPDELKSLKLPHSGLLPECKVSADFADTEHYPEKNTYRRLSLTKEDGNDPLLIIITPELQVALALQGKPGERNLLIRSDPETIKDLLKSLDLRLDLETSDDAKKLRSYLLELGELRSNHCLDKLFWPLLSQRLAGMSPSFSLQALPERSDFQPNTNKSIGEITLLEALTHEIRTPLATIRTLVRSILRRDDSLPDGVGIRLRQIDSECTEQIDRFGLIFNAAELQRQQPEQSSFARTNLGNMLELLHRGWSDQLARRGIKLHIDITPDLPDVLSDPEKLELMLGGLIDRSSRGLQPGGILFLELRPAGPRLKLQILSESSNYEKSDDVNNDENSEIGPILNWNPNTGSLQLSQAATQRLMASLGGRLAQRRGSALTVFFPISEENP